MPRQTLRIAFLNGGHNTNAFFTKHGGRRDWFQTILSTAATTYYPSLDLDIDVVEYNPLHHEWPNLDRAESTAQRKGTAVNGNGHTETWDKWDAVLIPGNRHGVYETDQKWIVQLLEFMTEAYRSTDIPIVGICFGHQVMAKVLGSEVILNPLGHEDGLTVVELTEEGRKFLRTEKRAFSILAAHQDTVVSPPPLRTVTNLGRTPLSPVQGLYIPGRLLTFQNHPELTLSMTLDVVESHLSEEKFVEFKERQDKLVEEKGVDSGWVAGKILGWILSGGRQVPGDGEMEAGRLRERT